MGNGQGWENEGVLMRRSGGHQFCYLFLYNKKMNKTEIQFKDYLNGNKMQLTRYENLTSNNIILKEAKENKVKDSKLK